MAETTGGSKAAAAGKGGKGAANQPSAAEMAAATGPSKTDIMTAEVLSYLELIKTGQKEFI